MGLSNAERQKRYRERLKKKASSGEIGKTLPQAMLEDLQANLKAAQAEGADIDLDMTPERQITEQMIDVVAAAQGFFMGGIEATHPRTVELLGGAEYCRELEQWRLDKLAWDRKRKNKGGPPPCPPIPGVT